MGELTNTRWGIWFRFACGVVALVLLVIPWFDQTRRLAGISSQWNQPSNYFLTAMATAIVGLLAPHWAMKPGALKLQRRLTLILCLSVLVAAAVALVLIGFTSIAMRLS